MIAAPTDPLLYGAVAVLVLVVAVVGTYLARRAHQEADAEVDALVEADQPDEVDGDADVVELDPPDIRGSRWGLVGHLYALYKQHVTRRKLASRGYVQWYLIDGTYPRPRMVKPEMSKGGIPQVDHDGVTYLMPKEAMVPSDQQGMWTVVHHVDDAMPLNLHDPDEHAIDPKSLDEYLTTMVSTDPPGLLDRLDLDPQDLLMYTIVAIIAWSVLSGMMGGG